MESNATHFANAEENGGADARQRPRSVAGGMPGQDAGVLGDHGRLFGMGGRCQEEVGGAKKNPGW
ncbi:hypothetical protein [Aeromonas allosaccharophila]|uniref:hypothetical protein n=1 Tax=Aeromonas allosaccharophila TaxID=656 RepID=UPI0015D57EFF|nr:hypothetical protein [Aeromonas allosaccharophila]